MEIKNQTVKVENKTYTGILIFGVFWYPGLQGLYGTAEINGSLIPVESDDNHLVWVESDWQIQKIKSIFY